MDVRTYRARTLHEALQLARRELGPEAAVLHTREVRGLLRWLRGGRLIEVLASKSVAVPSRLPRRAPVAQISSQRMGNPVAGIDLDQHHASAGGSLEGQPGTLHSMVDNLYRHSTVSRRRDLPEALFQLFTDLIDADVSEELSRELVERVRDEAGDSGLIDPAVAKARIARMIEDEVRVAEPITVTSGTRRLVALVGPTGVGKTTTIAKLAANYRLREKRRVGLITVDTYRIAAVEQLRTYADIIDLPMEVVSTPREMRQAVARLADFDLVLMDTAGRSPRDEVKIQELKSMLAEAEPDEVHLVLSGVASAASLCRTAADFAAAGTTALVITKLDEAASLGNLLPLVRSSRLPLSYLTHGQNVPDDIQSANPRRVARAILGMEPARLG